jgi:hypothetical protein
MRKEGVGRGYSPYFLVNARAKSVALSEAEKDLAWMLENSCDPVPCPRCGWLQFWMRFTLKWDRFYDAFAWQVIGGAVSAVAVFVLLATGPHGPWEQPAAYAAWLPAAVAALRLLWATALLLQPLNLSAASRAGRPPGPDGPFEWLEFERRRVDAEVQGLPL